MICDGFKQRVNFLMLLFGLKTAIIAHIFGQFYSKDFASFVGVKRGLSPQEQELQTEGELWRNQQLCNMSG